MAISRSSSTQSPRKYATKLWLKSTLTPIISGSWKRYQTSECSGYWMVQHKTYLGLSI